MTLPVSKTAFEALRRKAEKVAHRAKLASPTPADLAHALDELRVYGAELEIQNEELEQSRVEAEEMQIRYFRHFDLAPVGMIRLNDKGMVLEANILGARMLGIARVRCRSGKVTFAGRLGGDSPRVFRSHFKKTLSSSEMESCEISLVGDGGKETFVRMQSIASSAPEGRTDLFATLTDLTEHQRAEDHRLELERKLLERQKLENIGTLAGGIAHDLNNILQVINCHLDLAEVKGSPKTAWRKNIAEARHAADRATSLARRLLTFSKGGSPIKQTVNLRDILRSSVGFWLSGSKLRAELSVAPDVLPVTVDPVQFAQVIENVVINAREATTESGKLFVRASNVLPGSAEIADLGGGPWVKIEIEDEGGGIPEHIRDRVFELCFTTKPGGSGIGLSTAKSIMDQHGGRIALKSVTGQGTIVSLLLPAVAQPCPPPAPPHTEIVAKGCGRILVIDDEDMMLEVLPTILENVGYSATAAKDGAEGCEAYVRAITEGEPFAAVLLDATIPGGLGGEAALKRLLRVDPLAKVILFSGYADSDLMIRAEELGFKGRLGKPFTATELAATLQRALS